MTQINSSAVNNILNKLPKKYKKKILEENLPLSMEYEPENIGEKYILLKDLIQTIEVSWRKKIEDKFPHWIEYVGENNPSYYSFMFNKDTANYELSYFEFNNVNDKYHREDGPARVWVKEKRSEYYFNGKRLFFKDQSYVVLDVVKEASGDSYYKILTANKIIKLPYFKWVINDKGFFTYEP